MIRRLELVLGFLFLASTVVAQEPPAGFEWKAIPEIKAKFLVPPGWHFISESPILSKVHTYLITKEDLTTVQKFDTGMKITVEQLKAGSQVTDEAAAFVRTYLASGTVIEPFFEEDFGTMKAFGGVVSMPASSANEKFTIALNAIANPRTNALYKLSFQSATESWESTWKIGGWLIGRFKLDDEY